MLHPRAISPETEAFSAGAGPPAPELGTKSASPFPAEFWPFIPFLLPINAEALSCHHPEGEWEQR